MNWNEKAACVIFDVCKVDSTYGDSISFAYQMGRLDVVSLILTIFAILIAILGFFSYRTISREAKLTAKEVAEKEAVKVAIGKVEKFLEDYKQAAEINRNINDQPIAEGKTDVKFTEKPPNNDEDE